jgi:hypothetical protein
LIVGSGPHVRKSKRFVSLAELGVLGVGHIIEDAAMASEDDGGRRRAKKTATAKRRKTTSRKRRG